MTNTTTQKTPKRSEADMFLATLKHRFSKRVSEVRFLIETCDRAKFTVDELCAIRDSLVYDDQLTAFYQEVEIGREAGVVYLRKLMTKECTQSQSGLLNIFAFLRAAFR